MKIVEAVNLKMPGKCRYAAEISRSIFVSSQERTLYDYRSDYFKELFGETLVIARGFGGVSLNSNCGKRLPFRLQICDTQPAS